MRFRFSSHRSIATFLHGDVLFTDPPAPSSAVIHLPKTFSSIRIFYAVIKQIYAQSIGCASDPRCGFVPHLLHVSVTQYSSVSFVQISFGQATSRPYAHAYAYAAIEGPQPRFWGYVGVFPDVAFLPCLSYPSFPCTTARENGMHYLEPVISFQN